MRQPASGTACAGSGGAGLACPCCGGGGRQPAAAGAAAATPLAPPPNQGTASQGSRRGCRGLLRDVRSGERRLAWAPPVVTHDD